MKMFLRILGCVVVLALLAGCVFYWNPLWVNDERTRYHLWRADVRSEYLEAGGYRLHYFEAGPPDGSPGTPLLLVHGLGARGEDWAAMVPTLAANGFHVYAPDLLGFGRSDHPDVGYSIPLEEGVVVDFMHAVGLARADVDGWSMGGWIAAELALDYPGMVDRLVLDDSAGLRYPIPFARDAFVPTDRAGLNRLLALMVPDPPALPGFVVRATLRKVQRQGPIVQRTLDSMLSGSDLLDARLGGLSQPTLIVWGAEDKLIPIAVGEAMHRKIRGSVFEGVAGCGHMAPSQCSRPVLAATIRFLKAQPAMVGGEAALAEGP